MTTMIQHSTAYNGHIKENGYGINGHAASGLEMPAPKNRFLAALPSCDWQRLAPQMRYGTLRAGAVLHEEGAALRYVYFLDAGMACLLLSSREGACTEIGAVGREGMIGVEAASDNIGMSRVIIRIDATGWQMPAHAFADAVKVSALLQAMTLKYWQCLAQQAAQTALCNRLHSIEQRLCRWLLSVRDRAGADEFDVTQEFMAQMLGVARPGATIAAGALRTASLIDYTRGHIALLDVPGLEAAACECHGTLKGHLKRWEHAVGQGALHNVSRLECGEYLK